MIGIELRKCFKAVGNTDTIFQYSTCNLGKKQIAGKYIPSFLKFFIYFLYQSNKSRQIQSCLDISHAFDVIRKVVGNTSILPYGYTT